MSLRDSRLEELLAGIKPTNRREFLKRSVAMAAAVPAFGTLLAACGDDDDDDDDDEDVDADPTATDAPAGDDPTATEEMGEEEDEPTPTEEMGEEEDDPTPTEEMAAEEPTATEAEEEPSGNGEPVQGGVFVGLGHHEVASLSPDDWGPSVHFFIVGNIHGRLLKLDPFYVLQPDHAESFDVADDGLTYTFAIRDGITWHDGEAFDADDVAYTYNYYRNPDNAAATASNFVGVSDVQAADPNTVVVTLEQPNAALLTRLGQAGLVPQHHHSEIGEDAYKADPIGTGPFVLQEWRAAEFTECVRFDDYWEGAAHMDGIREDIVPEASVRAIALENGEADSAVWPLVTDDHVRFLEDPELSDYTVIRTSSVAVNHFMINNLNPIFQDKRVRQAMMFAIDRESIRDDLWQGFAALATANISPALEFYYEPDVAQYPYDPEQAAALLDEAGWTLNDDGVREQNGETLSWVCTIITGDQARRPEAELVQANLNEIGFDMQIEEAPLATIQEGQRSGDIDMSLYNWTYGGGDGEPDGANTLRSDARNNWSNWQNDQADELLDAGVIETDPEARRVIYSDLQKLVAEEVPFLFIKYWDWFNIYAPRIKGVPEGVLEGDGLYQFVHQMWIEE